MCLFSTAVEFPIVVVDGKTGQVIDEFHRYVRPTETPKLSKFCKQLTGITQVRGPGCVLYYCLGNCRCITGSSYGIEGSGVLASPEEKDARLRL